MIKNSIDAADEAGKLAQKYGLTAEAISTTAFAAGQAGLSMDQVGGAIAKLTKNMSDARDGTGEAKDAFAALGIELTDSRGVLQSSDKVMLQIADRFAGLEDGAEKTALAVDLFGRSGADMIPFLNQGASGIEALRQQARDLGLEISTNTAKQAELFNDRMDVFTKSAVGAGQAMAFDLLPQMTEVSGAMAEAARESGFLTAALVGFGGVLHSVFTDTPTQKIRALKDEIRELERAGTDVRRGGILGVSVDIGEPAALKELRKELAALEQQQRQAEEAAQRASDARAAQLKKEAEARAAETEALRKRVEARQAEERAAAEAEARLKAHLAAVEAQKKAEADIISQMQQQIALIGTTTNEETALVELRLGAYKNFSDATKERILDLAREKDAAEETYAAEQKHLQEIEQQARDAADARRKLFDEGAQVFESTRTPQERHDSEIQRLTGLRDSGAIDEDTFQRAVQQQNEALDAFMAKNRNAADIMAGVWAEAGRSIQGTLADFLFNPFDQGLKGMVKGFAVALQRMIAEAAAAQIIQALLGLSNGGGAGSATAAIAMALFGGARAEGGPVSPGKAYLVGERGPELMMPQRPGWIIPSDKLVPAGTSERLMGGGRSTTINIHMPPGTPAETRRAAGAGAREALAAASNARRYT
jgi:hypothetical protein